MNPRSVSNPLCSLAALALLSALSLANAQQAVPASPPPATTPASAAPAPMLPFRSALEGYQPYTDEKTVDWKAANDTTARIGGWRAYAKEASAPAQDGPVKP